MALYETEDGQPVTTQSMVKAFRGCPREAYYKYALRLQPKQTSLPLKRGTWMHSLLEEKYKGRDWRKVHKQLTAKFSNLFDEEKEKLGDLPRECQSLMESYEWFYGDPEYEDYEWNVLEVERKIEANMPNGHLFRGVVDLIVEDEFGIWLVDHKTHGKLPEWDYRLLDEQSTLYVWAAREAGIPVQGFIWNYISTSPLPEYNQVLKDESKFYSKSFNADTTYPAFVKGIRKAQALYPETFLKNADDKVAYRSRLAVLKDQRWKGPHQMSNSSFFRRDVLEKSDDLIERVLKSVVRTSDTMHSYDFSDPDCVERDVNMCKGFMCNFKDLSMSDLVNGDSSILQKRNYTQGDPLAYQEKGK